MPVSVTEKISKISAANKEFGYLQLVDCWGRGSKGNKTKTKYLLLFSVNLLAITLLQASPPAVYFCVFVRTLNICSGNWKSLKWCSISEFIFVLFFFSSSSSHLRFSIWFRSNLALPNLFCHVTPLIGWHVINSLACTVGCHLHGNKSLL